MDNDDELYRLAYESWWATRGWIWDVVIGVVLVIFLCTLFIVVYSSCATV